MGVPGAGVVEQKAALEAKIVAQVASVVLTCGLAEVVPEQVQVAGTEGPPFAF